MQIVDKLDELGKPAWIGLLVLSFVLFWPAGLALLAYLIWSGRMRCWKHGAAGRWHGLESRARRGWAAGRSSGNLAFDEYREATLRRLEDEQREFQDFLERLRHAKDKAEFDQFMADRRRKPDEPAAEPQA
jgi:hypothetical protein